MQRMTPSFSESSAKGMSSVTPFKNSDVNFEKFDRQNPYFHVIRAVKQNFPDLSTIKVLDVGCGRERKYQTLGFELARLGCIVTGIDLEYRNEVVSKNLRFVRSAAEDFTNKEKFDAVISAFFFGYVTSDWANGNGLHPGEYEICVLKKLRGLLAENGISVHYTHEGFCVSEEEVACSGFDVIRFPRPDGDPENWLLVVKKRG